MSEGIKEFSGHLIIYRLFDVAQGIDLELARQKLGQSEYFKLGKKTKNILIQEAPVAFALEQIEYNLQDKKLKLTISGKIWAFGALSLSLKVDLERPYSHQELTSLAWALEHDSGLHSLALQKAENVISVLGNAAIGIKLWNDYEDYIIYLKQSDSSEDIIKVLDDPYFYNLIVIGPGEVLSQQVVAPIRSGFMQYEQKDLLVIDWNSSYICSPGDAQDIADVIEFSLCQLLELRFYDELLDKQLNHLYNSIKSASESVLSRKFEIIVKNAGRLYVEVSEVVERIENGIKVTGDVYYAKVFRTACARLRVDEWKSSIDQKLKNLVDISEIYHNENNTKKSHLLELVIIFLIAVEVVPFLFQLFSK